MGSILEYYTNELKTMKHGSFFVAPEHETMEIGNFVSLMNWAHKNKNEYIYERALTAMLAKLFE